MGVLSISAFGQDITCFQRDCGRCYHKVGVNNDSNGTENLGRPKVTGSQGGGRFCDFAPRAL